MARFFRRRKFCKFTAEGVERIDYKDLATLKGYNVVGIFHGHEHPTPMIYNYEGYDIFKPVAAFLGGLALVRVTDAFLDVALARAGEDPAEIVFTHAFSKRFSR